ncbi:MAG: DUF512 domain-containing protein [Actinomycetota bacterium]|nr:DUF512 domain-containing protein [Actinomycetota bacterium]
MDFPVVSDVVPDSPASRAGVAVGDEMVAVAGVRPSDVIEYQQLVDEEEVEITLRRGGLEWTVTVEKAAGAPVGLRLDSSIFDRVQTCDNHCEFCFIYQLPRGMRKTLYLKDDDYRLSFLYGNFTTLTRFTELDLARVVEERLGPLYVSIHATDPVVRSRMLRNPRGATSLRWLRALLGAGIEVHGQIVLCPGVNDAEVLERTCAEILLRYPRLASVGVVPLGLSRYNTEAALRPHNPRQAAQALESIHAWQDIALSALDRRMFFASDELYLQAGWDFPVSEAYEGFSQHENGIGMARAFYDELERLERGSTKAGPARSGRWQVVASAPDEGYRAVRSLRATEPPPRPSSASGGGRPDASEGGRRVPAVVVTGEYGERVLEPVRERIERLCNRPLRLLVVPNTFFGGNVAASGLLVGADVKRALEEDREDQGLYLVPDVTLSGDRFLDDLTVAEVSAAASAPLRVVPTSAEGLVAGAAQ